MEIQPVKPKKILFVVNPISGHGKQNQLREWIDQEFEPSRFDVTVTDTTEPGHATELTRAAIEQGYDLVVAVGGDGTVNEVGQALVGSNVMMGIIPSGSGNGLARHLKIPLHFKKAVDLIIKGKSKRIDTATINGKVFLNIAGIGYDAYVARKFAKAGTRGFRTYFRIVTQEYPMYRPRKYKIEIDGKTIIRRALSVSFANSNQFGNNTSIDPEASLVDGLIDVCIVTRIPLLYLPFYAPLLFIKTFHKTQYIEIIRAKSAIVYRKKGKSIHFDGDPYKMGDTLEMKVNPLSLNIIVP
jgi:diacylglycerol kinase (ATP)